MGMADLQTLSDRLEIDDLVTRYTRAIDSGEWDRLDKVFTPDAHIDYTATGGIAGRYPEVKAWLAESLRLFPRRQHLVAQKEVDLDGDRADLTAYFLNPMVLARPDGSELLWEFGGLYRHHLRRTVQGWRSVSLVEELVWKRGL
jgi:ketosteroid isomerase-like protein